ncbi:SdpI family protein [Peribacillus sp. SCS-26]|uniref:SdpI family protein n=1 Tax=Paraperibacillus marinus TaxID=3115295 RepID=UPI0039062921
MKKHFLPLLIVAAVIIVWLSAYPDLPAEIPTHWNSSGEVDGYSSKLSAMLTSIGMLIIIYLILQFIPRVDPKRKNYQLFSKGYKNTNIAILILFFFINMLTIGAGLGFDFDMDNLVPLSVGLLLLVIGNYMPQFKPNYFVGIKTPWTLNNEDVWKRTHRFGGRVFIAGGLLLMLSTLLPDSIEFLVLPVILLIALLPILYSYRIHRKMEQN